MNSVATLLDQPIILKLSLALLHFLWQGAALAVVALLLLAALRHAKPTARYLALLVILAALVVTPVATFLTLPQPPARAAAAAQVASPIDWAGELGTLTAPPSPRPSVDASNPAAAQPTPSGTTGLRDALAARLADARAWLGAHLSWIAAGWLIGVLVLSLRLLFGWIGVGRAKRRGVQPAGSQWQTMLAALAQRLRVRQTVKLLESAVAEVPTVIGWLRPVILLPASALSGLTPEQLEALLAHELAHIRRCDYLVNLLQTVVETLLFYHPAVWWISARLRVEREQCCDDLAVACCGDAIAYARALTEMETLRSAPQPALGARGGSLLMRVRRLVGAAAPPSTRAASWPAGVLAIAALLAMSTAFYAVAAKAAEPQRPLRMVLRVYRPTSYEFRLNSPGVPSREPLRVLVEQALVSPELPVLKIRETSRPEGLIIESSAADEKAFAAQATTVTRLVKVVAPDLRLVGKRIGDVSPQLLKAARAAVEKRARMIDPKAQVKAQPPRDITVTLPQPHNRRLVAAALTAPGMLEFRAVPKAFHVEVESDPQTGGQATYFSDASGRQVPTERVLAQSPVVVRGDALNPNAHLATGQMREPMVAFEFNREGGQKFYRFTSTHKNQALAIMLDGRVISAPIIKAGIRSRGVIVGFNSTAQAQAVAIALNSRPLPVGIVVVR
jgi:beta-lactamase regulating signal transducer with metallopeptidase domain